MSNLIKLFIFVMLLGATLSPIYALASSRSESKASGEGVTKISGWKISNIHYQLSNDPAYVKSVAFDLDGPAGEVSVKLNSQSPAYTRCNNINAFHWQCDFPAGIGIASMDEFHLITVDD